MLSLPSRRSLADRTSRPAVRARLLIGLLAALALGIVLLATLLSTGGAGARIAVGTSAAGASTHELAVGAMAPDFQLTDVNTGQPVSLSSLRGRPVRINFWATWCPPCKVELPIIKHKYDAYKDKGLAI